MKVDVHELLQDDIVSGVFSPGDPLVELALADRYNVSRTPIREALRKLQADGLVEQFARGYRVSQISPQDILDLYDVRIAWSRSPHDLPQSDARPSTSPDSSGPSAP